MLGECFLNASNEFAEGAFSEQQHLGGQRSASKRKMKKNRKNPTEKQQIRIQKENVAGGGSCPFTKSKNLEALPRSKRVEGTSVKTSENGLGAGGMLPSIFPGF